MQPVITPAALVAAEKMMMNGAMNVMQTLAAPLGIPMNVREMEDPMGGYCFALEIQGVELAHFQECSGLKNSTEVFEIREGGVNHAVHKLPGASRWENLVLRYGVSSDISMMSLREQILNDDYSSGGMGSFSSSVGGMTANLGAEVSSLLGGGPGQAQPKRFNGSIVIKNNRMQEMVRYTFKDAWAVSWEGPKFDATNSSLAIESIEIAHHGIEVSRSWRAGIPMGWT